MSLSQTNYHEIYHPGNCIDLSEKSALAWLLFTHFTYDYDGHIFAVCLNGQEILT